MELSLRPQINDKGVDSVGAVADFQNSEYPFNLVERLFPDIDIKMYRRRYENDESIRATFAYFINLFPKQTVKVFALRFDKKMTYEQIGEQLGVSKARAAQIIDSSISDFLNKRKKYKTDAYMFTADIMMQGLLEVQREKWRSEGEEAALDALRRLLIDPNVDIVTIKKKYLYDDIPAKNMSLQDFTNKYGLSVRCSNAIARQLLSGFSTPMNELCRFTENEVRRFRNLGVATFRELTNALNRAGLSLRKDEE